MRVCWLVAWCGGVDGSRVERAKPRNLNEMLTLARDGTEKKCNARRHTDTASSFCASVVCAGDIAMVIACTHYDPWDRDPAQPFGEYA